MLTMIYMTCIQNMPFFLLKVNNPSVRHPVWPRLAPRLSPSGFATILQWFCNGFAMVLQWFCKGFAMMSGQTGGQMGADGGPDGVPNGSHVIGHIIFECHITHLGWQGVILLPTLLSQR
jgi:hypothetical protein